ncbi:MAG TPA: Ezrin/radixin/moesin family protein [Cytophagales bacterium]|nr:Ezrin/radixin/moesin family protein [Cytophagales bacterium]
MKKLSFAIAVCLCVATGINAFGQKLTKEQKKEAKEIKKQMSAMDPFEFKKVMEEHTSLKSEVSSLNDKVASLEGELVKKDAEVQNAQNQLQESLQKQAQAKEETQSSVSTKGVIFKVQIGAFRNKNLEKYLKNNVNFSGESDPDGTRKYTLGLFRDYWEADTFKKYLREMGVKDAWIVPYRDGERVALKDVLEEQQLKKIKS